MTTYIKDFKKTTTATVTRIRTKKTNDQNCGETRAF